MKLKLIYCILPFLFSCVSISKIETSFQSVRSGARPHPTDIIFYLAGVPQDKCLSEDQESFLKDMLSKYFEYLPNDKIKVVIDVKVNNNLLVAYVNIVASAVTFTVVPLYVSNTYNVEIEIASKDTVKLWKASVKNEQLISILALPFQFHYEDKHIKRINFKNALYKASLEAPRYESISNYSLSDIKQARKCEGFRDNFKTQNW